MTSYLARRLLYSAAAFLLLTLTVFSAVRLLPGNAVYASMAESGFAPSQEQIRIILRDLGLNGSYPTQYVRWLGHALQGDLGQSFVSKRPVNGMLRQEAPLSASSHLDRTGLSEPMPMPGSPDWSPAYGDWARRVRVDLAALKSYAEAVYAATDGYLAGLSDADLDRELDLSAVGFGKQKLSWMLNFLVLNHIGT